METNPMHPTSEIKTIKLARRDPSRLNQAKRCHAATRKGTPCQCPAVHGKARCRMHGGALGSGAPSDKGNGAYRHGRQTGERRAERRMISGWLKVVRKTIAD